MFGWQEIIFASVTSALVAVASLTFYKLDQIRNAKRGKFKDGGNVPARNPQEPEEVEREPVSVSVGDLETVLAFRIGYALKSAPLRRYTSYALSAACAWHFREQQDVVDVEITLCQLHGTPDCKHYFRTHDIPSPVKIYKANK